MCLRIFVPTPRRVFLFLIFLAFTLSGLLAFLPPFQQLFGLPYLLVPEIYTAIVVQLIYSYILACIYAFAYVWLESKIRQRYPHMNDLVKKRQKPLQEPLQEFQAMPAAEEPEMEQVPPEEKPPAKRVPRKHARKRATRKKPKKRR